MATGYLDLAYLIEISVVFNLAYREIKHGTVLTKMQQIREKMSQDEEFQERIEKIKADNSLAGNKVKSDYKELIAVIDRQPNDCPKGSWNHNRWYCKYFFKTVLTGSGIAKVNISIVITLLILLFATISSHMHWEVDAIVWCILFSSLVIMICIPMYLLFMSEKVSNILMGKNGDTGMIDRLEHEFRNSYNQYLVEQAEKPEKDWF